MPTSAEASASSVEKGTASLMTRILFKAALCAGAMAIGCGSASAQIAPAADARPAATPGKLSEGVAAIVNDHVISTYDLAQRTRLLVVTSGVQPTEAAMQQVQQEALRSLIDESLETQEIQREEKEQKFSIMASDADVDDDVSRIARSNHMSGPQLLNALKAAGVRSETFKNQLRTQMSWERWIDGRYGGSRMKVGQDQVNAVLKEIEVEAVKPQYEVNEIFLDAARVGGQSVAMDGAQQLIAQMKQGAPFAAVARQFSGAATAANGGDAGWLTEVQLPAEVRDVVINMKPGEMSAPIAVRDGVYIVQLHDKRAGAGTSLVGLKQAAVNLGSDASDQSVEAARQKLLEVKRSFKGCADFEAKADRVGGVQAADLGETDIKDLTPAFRDALDPLQPDQISDPIRTPSGLRVLALCTRRPGGVEMPTRAEIESRLEDEKLAQVSRRYLRDLTNSATIELR